MKKINTHKLALLSVLSAQALAMSFLENLLPALPFLPPGVKLGLSNVVTMFCAGTLGFSSAVTVTVIKSLFNLVTRGVTAFFMSLGGGLFSTVAMCFMMRFVKDKSGYIGVAVVSSVCHNFAQLIVSVVITKTVSMFNYAPVLLLSGIVMGIVTGLILKVVMPLLLKQSEYFKM